MKGSRFYLYMAFDARESYSCWAVVVLYFDGQGIAHTTETSGTVDGLIEPAELLVSMVEQGMGLVNDAPGEVHIQCNEMHTLLRQLDDAQVRRLIVRAIHGRDFFLKFGDKMNAADHLARCRELLARQNALRQEPTSGEKLLDQWFGDKASLLWGRGRKP